MSQVWPPHCIIGTPGNELAEGLDVDKIGRVILKGRDERVEMYSAFRTPLRDPPLEWEREHGGVGELAKILIDEKVTDVVIVGLAGDYCVKASALDCAEIAQESGVDWKCWIVEEGVRSVGGEKAWEESKRVLSAKGITMITLDEVKQVCCMLRILCSGISLCNCRSSSRDGGIVMYQYAHNHVGLDMDKSAMHTDAGINQGCKIQVLYAEKCNIQELTTKSNVSKQVCTGDEPV